MLRTACPVGTYTPNACLHRRPVLQHDGPFATPQARFTLGITARMDKTFPTTAPLGPAPPSLAMKATAARHLRRMPFRTWPPHLFSGLRAHQATTASATATPSRLGLCIRYCVRSATAIANTTCRASATLLTMHACSAWLARLAAIPCGRPASTASPDMSIRRVLPLVTLDVNLWLL